MKTVTKRDLVVAISNETGLTQREVFSVVQGFIQGVTDTLADGNEVALRNFGSFTLRVTKPRVGRNPNRPATDVPIPERAVVKFKPGKEMKDRVAGLVAEVKAAPPRRRRRS